MVSTPKSSNITNDSNSNNKINIMSPYQDISQYFDPVSTDSPQVKTGDYDPYLYDLLTGNDIFHAETPIYDISPVLASSMTTPSLILDASTPQDLNDSPIFQSFVASPSLDPPLGFFPDLSSSDPSVAAVARRSLMHLNIAPSVTIPADDSLPLTAPSVTIPADVSSPLTAQSVTFPGSSISSSSSILSPALSSTPSTPSINGLNTRNRKRSSCDVDKDPQVVADELALKRAKNTDAARRSRLRRVMKMESLERQVAELKTENNDLQTRIAVLESEKKGLEDKNAEKDARVKMLEQQLAEAHERLIQRTNIL
jgi:hypothetical protein